MNKKAIATEAMIITAVFFFTIVITTGAFALLNFTTTKQHSIESVSETINHGITLRNYLRTPAIIKNVETNYAELIIYSIKNKKGELIDKSLQNIKPFFWKIEILEENNTIFTFIGNQTEPTRRDKIIQEQIIPSYFEVDSKPYKVKMISKKMKEDKWLKKLNKELFNESTWTYNPKQPWNYTQILRDLEFNESN